MGHGWDPPATTFSRSFRRFFKGIMASRNIDKFMSKIVNKSNQWQRLTKYMSGPKWLHHVHLSTKSTLRSSWRNNPDNEVSRMWQLPPCFRPKGPASLPASVSGAEGSKAKNYPGAICKCREKNMHTLGPKCVSQVHIPKEIYSIYGYVQWNCKKNGGKWREYNPYGCPRVCRKLPHIDSDYCNWY